MEDSLNTSLRERFQGHEAPVDPALWQVIEARLIAAGPATDPVNELFRERFHGHEANVGPHAWEGISQQLGHQAGVLGSFTHQWGWWVAGIGAMAIAGAILLRPTPQEPIATENPPVREETSPAQPAIAVPAESATNTAAGVAIQQAAPDQSASAQRASNRQHAHHEPAIATDAHEDASALAEEPTVVEVIIENITVRAMLDALGQEAPSPAAATAMTPDPMPEPLPAQPVSPAQPVESGLFLPNTFTPNGDGFNDTYQIVPRAGLVFTSTLVRVYSMKSNQLVFSGSNLSEPWTGAGCEDGMYLVAVEAITVEGQVVSEGRVVWLNRSSMN